MLVFTLLALSVVHGDALSSDGAKSQVTTHNDSFSGGSVPTKRIMRREIESFSNFLMRVHGDALSSDGAKSQVTKHSDSFSGGSVPTKRIMRREKESFSTFSMRVNTTNSILHRAVTRPHTERSSLQSNIRAIASDFMSNIPLFFVHMASAIGDATMSKGYATTPCIEHVFDCAQGNQIKFPVCQHVECPFYLRMSLLQAREFNSDVTLLEQGGTCSAFCSEHRISYQIIPWSSGVKSFCMYYPASKQMLDATPARKSYVFVMAALRWFVLDDFLLGGMRNEMPSVEPPSRFAMADQDQMIYVNAADYFKRLGDVGGAICRYGRHSVNANYAFFTKETFHDIVAYYRDNLALWEHHWGSDMDVLTSYTWPDTTVTADIPHPNVSARARFAVVDSCAPFPDGRIVENLNNDGPYGRSYEKVHGHRQLFYRQGQLHSRILHISRDLESSDGLPPTLANGLDSSLSSNSLERSLGVHFGSELKKLMEFHFRPNLEKVDESCRSCLLGDCDCEDLACKNCWDSCFANCSVLQRFHSSTH